jgi:hypothetical protein
VLGGCSCNAPNILEQSYCQAYSQNTIGPAIVTLIGFFVLAAVSVWLFWRWYRPKRAPTRASAQDRARDPLPWAVGGLATRPACEVLQEVFEAHPGSGHLLEGYDGRWLVELSVPAADPPIDEPGEWTTRDEACRQALELLELRGVVVAQG